MGQAMSFGAHIIGYLWDRFTFIPWYIMVSHTEKLRIAGRVKSVQDENDPTLWKSGDSKELIETYYYGFRTMNQIFEKTCHKFINLPALGTRELLSEVDEVQPNGKVFKKAIFGKYNWITFQELLDKVDAFAKGLSQLGIKKVGIYMESRADWMIAVQACFRHNIQVVTVYATLGEDAVAMAIEENELECIITSGPLAAKNIVGILKIVKLKTVIWAPFETVNKALKIDAEFPNVKFMSYTEIYDLGNKSILKAPEPPKPESIAVIMYTSGTSGKPKGVMISHSNMTAACSGIGERLMIGTRFSPADTYLGYLPLAHILELVAEQTVLFNGARIGYSSALTLSDQSSRIKKGSKGDATELKPTVMASVPEILERIRKGVLSNVKKSSPISQWIFNFSYNYKLKQVRKGRDTPILNKIVFGKTSMLLGGHMRAMLSGGAPLEEATQRFMEICIKAPCVIGYGLTETCGGVAINDTLEIRSGRTGGVIDTGLVKLVEWKEGGYSPYSDPPRGEVWFGGPGVAMGYYKMPEKTAEDFHIDENGTRWFATGDIGQFEDDGSLRIIDRKKDLVKLRHGEYIALSKIEAALKFSSLVTNVCVFVDSNELTCVVVACGNETELTKVAKEHGLTGDFSEWSNHKVINDAVMKDFVNCGKTSKLQKGEMPSKIYVESMMWLPDTGLITDAFKLKRKALSEKYEAIVNQLYNK